MMLEAELGIASKGSVWLQCAVSVFCSGLTVVRDFGFSDCKAARSTEEAKGSCGWRVNCAWCEEVSEQGCSAWRFSNFSLPLLKACRL